jgi:excisionase family DNA binding protein
MKTNVIEEKMIYTTHEVAKILHSSPNYIYELIKKGKLKAVKLKSLKIRKSALEEFLKENEGNDLSDIDNVRKIVEYEDKGI